MGMQCNGILFLQIILMKCGVEMVPCGQLILSKKRKLNFFLRTLTLKSVLMCGWLDSVFSLFSHSLFQIFTNIIVMFKMRIPLNNYWSLLKQLKSSLVRMVAHSSWVKTHLPLTFWYGHGLRDSLYSLNFLQVWNFTCALYGFFPYRSEVTLYSW